MRRVLLILLLVLIAVGDIGVPSAVVAQSFFGFGQQAPPEVVPGQSRRTAQQYYQQQQTQQPAAQQPPRRRTLLDMLFGPSQQELQQEQQQQLLQQQQAKPKPPPPPQLPPATPTVAKAAGATRVAVFGDSMAVDVGKALDRFYADDPDVAIIQQAVPSSGFARPDYFDWNKTIADQIKANSFDVAVMIVGINDRQTISDNGQSYKSLTDDWNKVYSDRLSSFVSQLRAANKPLIWIGLPPMAGPQFSNAMSQISSLERLASFGNGAEFVDIYDKFLDENGNYEQSGPDVNGNTALMRKSDGIHFASAGADKVAFYADPSIRLFVHGGAGAAVADPLAGTDAAAMLRPPYQGLGQSKLLQLAGAVMPLTGTQPRAEDLIEASASTSQPTAGFDMKQLVDAPTGRADAFGVGIDPAATNAAEAPAQPVAAAVPGQPAAAASPAPASAAQASAVTSPAAVTPTVATAAGQ